MRKAQLLMERRIPFILDIPRARGGTAFMPVENRRYAVYRIRLKEDLRAWLKNPNERYASPWSQTYEQLDWRFYNTDEDWIKPSHEILSPRLKAHFERLI